MRDDHVPAWRRWLPSMTWGGTCMAEPEGEAEGWYVQIRWGRFVIELQFATFDRDIDGENANAR